VKCDGFCTTQFFSDRKTKLTQKLPRLRAASGVCSDYPAAAPNCKAAGYIQKFDEALQAQALDQGTSCAKQIGHSNPFSELAVAKSYNALLPRDKDDCSKLYVLLLVGEIRD